ncbi:MAG: hypothetical protein HOV66_19340 [Streptomycetaceae bacterium]|nr:hypothetical protein [Streptomycetaceae bacterium]NUS56987.1 hypothetical protein [Streptomycetaceae bacterium]
MHPDHDPRSTPPHSPGPGGSWPSGPQPWGGPPHQGANPWTVTAIAAVLAVALISLLIATSGGSGSSKPAAFTDPGGDGPPTAMPTLPSGFPTMPSSTGLPTAPGRTNAPGSGTGSPSASASGPNPLDRADTDTHPFTAAEWFHDKGDMTIQKRPYTQLAQDERGCSAAEAGLRSLLGSDCKGIVRSLWTEPTHTYVGSLSVVSMTDKQSAKSVSDRLASGASNGQYVSFITPPSGSGVKFSEQSRTWVGTMVSGHYLIVVEVARSDGKAAGDSGSVTMWNDIRYVAVDHTVAWIWE